MIDDATRRQLEAANPKKSTWLSANAGSGKTRVLTDRVARLLLDGVQPQRILCLTYTKAAASEMQNRLFKRLGDWAMLGDVELRKALAELGAHQSLDDADLRQARTLFARAIETPGGLKIQTIHSFCAALLRRFPLEAGVSPQFVEIEIENRAAVLLRNEIVEAMAGNQDAHLVVGLARLYNGTDFEELTRTIVQERSGFQSRFSSADLMRDLGHPTIKSMADVIEQSFDLETLPVVRELASALAAYPKEQTASQLLGQISRIDVDALEPLRSVCMTNEGKKRKRIATQLKKESPHLFEKLERLMDQVEAALEAKKALKTVEYSRALHAFARQFLQLYTEAKERRGWLDFDDLIEKARMLLSDSKVAAWVLFRIDGGIDHILVDEAQDTGPSQWDVIRKLAEEFAAGEGARENVERTIFVVGDQKQSIYSFQGADPRAFDAMRNEFDARLTAAGQGLQQTSLDYSFRSSPTILSLVDTVFDGTPGFPAASGHIAFHDALPGRVDIWDHVPKAEDDEDNKRWFEPVDRKSEVHHHRVMAKMVAERIKKMLDDKEPLPVGVKDGQVTGQVVQPRDFLILVGRRSGVFHEIIRACKELELPIAGADRLRVGAEIAVKDLAALLSFLATPDDDLSLATALRSPLFGWSEQDLFTLAHHRGKKHLWEAMRDAPVLYADTLDVLHDLRSRIDLLRPYELLDRILTRHNGRKRLLGRLGSEAEDGVDALLSQALAYESNSIPSLTGFLVWMETDDLTIKRQIDSAANQIRIMTVHGAKGLEAPIVILPECGKHQSRERGDVRIMKGQGIWRMSKSDQPAAVRALIAAQTAAAEEERLRLLYVALTRAEKWLVLGAAGDLEKDGSDWYSRVKSAAQTLGAETFEHGLRLEYGDWRNMHMAATATDSADIPALEPYFSTAARRPADSDRTLSPSMLSGAKVLPGEGLDEQTALTYGSLVHHLLEHVPGQSPRNQQAIVAEALKRFELDEALAQSAIAEAAKIHTDPAFSFLFADSTLAEVSITADWQDKRLHGTIDRLIVGETEVLAVDFKSNRQVPKRPEETPDGILRQLGAYAHALAQIYPEKTIKTAILWTASSTLMELSHDIVTDLLHDTRYLDASGSNS